MNEGGSFKDNALTVGLSAPVQDRDIGLKGIENLRGN
jgi:hypothetical protein